MYNEASLQQVYTQQGKLPKKDKVHYFYRLCKETRAKTIEAH